MNFSRIGAFIRETGKPIVVSLVIVWIVRSFIVQPFYVRGASMEPNFEDNEYLIVNEIGYRFATPERGDVVVFRYPLDPSEFFIKRIIGLPGETIGIERGSVTIKNSSSPNGFILKEPYLPANTFTGGETMITLDEDQYYVLGDNRSSSSDSRRWGPLNRRNIVGRVWLRAWPVSRIGAIHSPMYMPTP
jgi:signal peptidase I